MTPRQIDSRVQGGILVPLYPGVYRTAGAATSAEQVLYAACLAAGQDAVASHRGAAWLWRLRGFDEPFTEVSVPAASQPALAGVVVHRTRSLGALDVSRTRRMPVTTPARTLLDLGAVVEPDLVEAAMEDALMRRLVSFELLARTVQRLSCRGRAGASVLRALVEDRDPVTAPTQSLLEDNLLRLLRRAGLPEPIRQHWVGGVCLDFAYPETKLGIEADSRLWHGARVDVQRNSDKGNVLVGLGWRVLHFTWADVHRRAGYVAQEVVSMCPA